ncbi:MAG: transposase [Actinomycetales bacterium]|nr:transposase [Actinomycetales bacterium]
MIVNETHLRRVLTTFLEHYNQERPHRGLDLNIPVPVALGHQRSGEV